MPELSRIERPSVRVTRTLLPAVEKRMAELFDARFNTDDVPLTRDALVAAMADCDVLVPTVTDSIDASIIAAAPPRLKLIASYGAGVNHIDLAAAKAKGIMVTNTPGVFTDDTADLTMALILNVPRRLGEGHRAMRNGEWSGWSPTGMLGHRIGGKTLGIVRREGRASLTDIVVASDGRWMLSSDGGLQIRPAASANPTQNDGAA